MSTRVADSYTQGSHPSFCPYAKGRRYCMLPAHQSAQECAEAYLEAVQLRAIRAHSFSGTGTTEYLRRRDDLRIPARIARHESTRTSQICERVPDENSLDEIERLHIRDGAGSVFRVGRPAGTPESGRLKFPRSRGSGHRSAGADFSISRQSDRFPAWCCAPPRRGSHGTSSWGCKIPDQYTKLNTRLIR